MFHKIENRLARLALTCLAAGGVFASAAGASAQDAAPAPIEAGPPAGSVGGMGDINLYPKRIVIDARQRIATVGLYNRTANAGDYEINITDMMMTPDGRLLAFDNFDDAAAKANVKTASDMLRWSPRRIRLMGNEAQTVRIMSRTPADLPDGEYRSHFMAVSVPDAQDFGYSIGQATGQTPAADEIGVTIRPRFGISIPVIVRVGETTLDVGLSNLQLVNGPEGDQGIGITIARSGTRSAFGDITIKLAGSSTVVSQIKGIGVYPEVASRTLVVPVDPELPAGTVRSGTRLEVTYTDDDVSPGATLATQVFTVP